MGNIFHDIFFKCLNYQLYSPICNCKTITIITFAFRRGPNRWRDSFLPKDALDDWITAKCLRPAEWAWDPKSKPIPKPISVTVNGHTYKQSGKTK